MGLDESLFHRVHRWWTATRRKKAQANEFDLQPREPRFARLLTLLLGEPVELVIGDGRTRLNDRVVLPATMPLGSKPGDVEAVLTLQLALTAAAWNLAPCDSRFAPFEQPARPEQEDSEMQAALPRMLAWLDDEWPAVRELIPIAERYIAHLRPHFGNHESAGLQARLTTYGYLPLRALADNPVQEVREEASADSLPTGTERQRKRRGDVEVVETKESDESNNPLAHVFEKVRTAEEHTGGNRSIDGSDELDQQMEALDDIDLSRVVRSRTKTASVLRADIDFVTATGDLVDTGPKPTEVFAYDEWDERMRRYLPEWCAVGEAIAPAAPPDCYAPQVAAMKQSHFASIRRIRAEFARLLRGNVLLPRQAIGSDIDVDAVVDRHGDLRAAQQSGAAIGEARLYVARRPAAHEVAVTILFDRSLSSDSWVNGRRVLDLTRQSMVLLAEALTGVPLPVSVAAFCSHTRRDCRFDVIKGFREPWARMAPRLFDLEPDGYTRIGPAVRHATHRLSEQPARRRLLLIVSDCKPVDYDHYEGRRGLGDVRQAVREARRAGTRTLALAIDAQASNHLAQMFGPRGFRILPDVQSLTRAMAKLHEHMMRS